MRESGKRAYETLMYSISLVKPGITTREINDKTHAYIEKQNLSSACTFYQGFPHSICTSVNHVVCHGIPSNYTLKEGDIINIDVTTIYNGWHGDTSKTIGVGNISSDALNLIRHAENTMIAGISTCYHGKTTNDISLAMEKYISKHPYSMVKEYCGHGIGKKFHDSPQILNFTHENPVRLKEGMCFTVEPMVNIGKNDISLENDGWTVVTQDRSLSAQFEHTIGIHETGYTIFTSE